eukprot:6324470-Pyramimonas_sp.AAC.1
MQAPAAAGGFSAVQVPEPEFPAEVALALRAQDDLDGEWKAVRGNPGDAAYEDWTCTLQALKRAARRRFAPTHSAPRGGLARFVAGSDPRAPWRRSGPR